MMFSHENKNLVELCLRNNRIAQKKLFDKYYAAMYTSALRITGDEQQAYDAVQETFICVFNNLHQFKFRSTLGAWIKKILLREALRIHKKNLKTYTQIDEQYDELTEWPESINSEYLQRIILELPDGYRAIFTLIEIEGYTHKEVARKLNISEGTSKSQLYHAKKELRKRLAEFKHYGS